MMCNGPFWLQEEGFDTVDANRQLGLPDDAREYSSVMNILKDLRISSVKLIVRVMPLTCLRQACAPCKHTPACCCMVTITCNIQVSESQQTNRNAV